MIVHSTDTPLGLRLRPSRYRALHETFPSYWHAYDTDFKEVIGDYPWACVEEKTLPESLWRSICHGNQRAEIEAARILTDAARDYHQVRVANHSRRGPWFTRLFAVAVRANMRDMLRIDLDTFIQHGGVLDRHTPPPGYMLTTPEAYRQEIGVWREHCGLLWYLAEDIAIWRTTLQEKAAQGQGLHLGPIFMTPPTVKRLCLDLEASHYRFQDFLGKVTPTLWQKIWDKTVLQTYTCGHTALAMNVMPYLATHCGCGQAEGGLA